MNESKKKVRQKVQVEQNHLFLGPDDSVLPGAEGAGEMRVSEFLKTHRLRNKLSLTKVSQELRIREDYLLAIEEEEQRRLPEMAYTLGFVRSYANFLGFDGAEVVRMFKVEQDFDRHVPEMNDLVSQVSERSVPSKKILLFAGIGIIFSVLLGMLLAGGKTNNSLPREESSNIILEPIKQNIDGEETQSVPTAVTHALESAPQTSESSTLLAPPEAIVASSSQPEVGSQSNSKDENAFGSKDENASEQTPKNVNQTTKSENESAAPLTESQAQSGMKDPEAAVELPPLANGPALLKSQDTAWVRIFYADGRIVLDRVMNPGETLEIQLGQKLFLSTGNLGSLQIEVEGNSYFLKGKMGEVKRNIPLEANVLNDYVTGKSTGH